MNPHDRRVHSEDESWPCAIATFIPSLAAMTAPSSESLLRPVRFNASEAALADQRRRAAGTKSPEHETTVADATQGARLATCRSSRAIGRRATTGARQTSGRTEAERTVLQAPRLYTQFVAQGGDWRNAVTEQTALQAPPELIVRHTVE